MIRALLCNFCAPRAHVSRATNGSVPIVGVHPGGLRSYRIRNKVVGWMILVLIGLVGTLACGANRARAADLGASELYGQGVHAYFAGEYDKAIKLLTASIAKRDSDPRAYYFRGLALTGSKGLEAGSADLAKGADLEVHKKGKQIFDVSAALQRIQGVLRLEIEKQRSAAHRAAAERKKKRDQARYEQLKRREDIVLFDPNRPAPEVPPNLPKPKLNGQSDPFASGLAFTGGKQVDYVAPDVLQVEQPTSQTASKPEAKDEPAGRDPFASGKKEDPFATPIKKEDKNPFGDDQPATKPMKAEPAGGDANPFGDDMPEVELDPNAKPAAGPSNEPSGSGKGAGSSVIGLLGKMLSGKSGDRDPFADSEKDGAARSDDGPPDNGPPSNNPPEKPAGEKPAGKKPAAEDDDPFK